MIARILILMIMFFVAGCSTTPKPKHTPEEIYDKALEVYEASQKKQEKKQKKEISDSPENYNDIISQYSLPSDKSSRAKDTELSVGEKRTIIIDVN